MSLKETCLICGAIGAAAIIGNEPDTKQPDPEVSGQEGLSQEYEFARRTQDIATFLARALDQTDKNHWEWPAGFEAMEGKHANQSGGAMAGIAQQFLPILSSIGQPALAALIQSLVNKPAVSTPSGVSLPPLGTAK